VTLEEIRLTGIDKDPETSLGQFPSQRFRCGRSLIARLGISDDGDNGNVGCFHCYALYPVSYLKGP